MQEDVETTRYDEEVVHTDEEGTINNMGSTKGVLESYLRLNKNFVTKEFLRCKKLSTKSGNALN